jgi:hypothetical protein
MLPQRVPSAGAASIAGIIPSSTASPCYILVGGVVRAWKGSGGGSWRGVVKWRRTRRAQATDLKKNPFPSKPLAFR